MNALELALLWLDAVGPSADGIDPRLFELTEYIGAHLTEALDVATLAARAHLTPSHLTRLFTQHLGLGVQADVERERMGRAVQLLASTGLSVQQIARESGWSDPLYFSRRFRR